MVDIRRKKPLVTHQKPLVTHQKPLVTHQKTLVTHQKPLIRTKGQVKCISMYNKFVITSNFNISRG